MVDINSLSINTSNQVNGYRLINSKFPPIHLFDDVASQDEFEALYALQERTNPRIQNQIGNLNLIDLKEIPFGIEGCSYASAPFTHVNPDGSRFSDGMFGVLYIADTIDTAIKEVKYHQNKYWQNVPELNFERFVFRGLTCNFDEQGTLDALSCAENDPIYLSDNYSSSQALGIDIVKNGHLGIRYRSVRHEGAICWGLTTPRHVTSIIQTSHYEMIWSSGLISVGELSLR